MLRCTKKFKQILEDGWRRIDVNSNALLVTDKKFTALLTIRCSTGSAVPKVILQIIFSLYFLLFHGISSVECHELRPTVQDISGIAMFRKQPENQETEVAGRKGTLFDLPY